ncbi:MAG: hypothetical protein ACOYOU_01405 [Kiritimatiellia bacterium]
MSQARNIRCQVVTARWRTWMVLLCGWMLFCSGGLAEEPVVEDSGVAQERATSGAWSLPPASSRRPTLPPPRSAAPAVNSAPALQYVFSKGSPVAPEPVVAPASAIPAPPVAAPKAPSLVQEKRRDPFWPIDYVRPVLPGEKVDPIKDVKVYEAEWREAESALHGAAKNWGRMPGKQGADLCFVLINGKPFEVGDTVVLAANGKTYRWRVASISLQSGPVFERMLPTPGAASSKR